MNVSGAPISNEKLADAITADNARELLAHVGCPCCEAHQTLDLFYEPNNRGVGIVCRGCGTRHPLRELQIMWLRQVKPRRSNDIVTIMKERGAYCYGCGNDYQTLRQHHVGMHVHHTRPFAEHGEKYSKIPTCAFCHELLSAAQRHMTKLLTTRQQTPVHNHKPGGKNG